MPCHQLHMAMAARAVDNNIDCFSCCTGNALTNIRCLWQVCSPQAAERTRPGVLDEAVACMSSLTLLVLDVMKAPWFAAAPIEAIAGLGQLQSLALTGFRDPMNFPSLSTLTNLTCLVLDSCLHLADLTFTAQMPLLRQLNCNHAVNLAIEGVSELTALSLSSFHASHCAFSRPWIPVLAALTSLVSLDISVGNWGNNDIIALCVLKGLQRLNIKDCPGVDGAALSILKDNIPDLVVQCSASEAADPFAGFLSF